MLSTVADAGQQLTQQAAGTVTVDFNGVQQLQLQTLAVLGTGAPRVIS